MKKSLQRGPIAWMASHSVASNLVLFFLLLGGVLALRVVQKEVFPDITQDIVQVSIAYPGASPEEVEKAIVLAVEETVTGLEGVKEINSAASEGSASIQIEMLEGEDLNKLAQDIQSEVDRIRTFPEGRRGAPGIGRQPQT